MSVNTDWGSRLFASTNGEGLLYFAKWYDPWLVGADLDPDFWRWPIDSKSKSALDGAWELNADTAKLDSFDQSFAASLQYEEQRRLLWNLKAALNASKLAQSRAHVFYSREVLGGSLSEDEWLT